MKYVNKDLRKAIKIAGATAIAKNYTPPLHVRTPDGWANRGFLPLTDVTGETNYVDLIIKLCAKKNVIFTREQLLKRAPKKNLFKKRK